MVLRPTTPNMTQYLMNDHSQHVVSRSMVRRWRHVMVCCSEYLCYPTLTTTWCAVSPTDTRPYTLNPPTDGRMYGWMVSWSAQGSRYTQIHSTNTCITWYRTLYTSNEYTTQHVTDSDVVVNHMRNTPCSGWTRSSGGLRTWSRTDTSISSISPYITYLSSCSSTCS